jgi:DNA polymerase (family X)
MRHSQWGALRVRTAAIQERFARGEGPSQATRLVGGGSHDSKMTSRIPLGRAWTIALALIHALSDRVTEILPAGSLRRFNDTVGHISLLAVTSSPLELFDRLATMPGVTILQREPATSVVRFERERVIFYTTPPETAGAALLHYTGSSAHTNALLRRATMRDLDMGPAGVQVRKTGKILLTQSEEQVYDSLGLPFIAPELREGQGEVDAAEAGTLPTLVERQQIRGDLHMHSTWSDGRDDIELMVRQSVALGYEYIAITDHSLSSAGAGGLTIERLRRQRHEVDEVRRRFPNIAILHGSEVDILPDGSLDFPDAVLAELDIVLASLHDPAGQSGNRLTERYLLTIQHPLVNIITHPTNRLIGYRTGYDLDLPRLFEAAAATGTILEIDGAPMHLDMDGALAWRAVDAGVMVSIDGDCHRAALLDRQMLFGVATARRGWCEARHVVNTRPLSELREILNRKRGPAGGR